MFAPRFLGAPLGVLIFLASLSQLQAKEITVFSIRKNIPLANTEAPNKDYYLDSGSGAGLKRGMKVSLTRSILLKEASEDNAAKVLRVPIGSLKIIHVQDDLSVGRLEKLFSRDELPMVENLAPMVGDQIDLNLNEKDFAPLKSEAKPAEAAKTVKAAETVEAVEPARVVMNP